MMHATRMPRPAALAALVAVAFTLGACATPAPGTPPSAVAPPAAGGLLTTAYPVTVLDDDDGGAELCLGGVLTSLPPQCGGPALVGWDWAAHAGAFGEASGVRWGEFVVTGTYDPDADTFTPTEVVRGADAERPAPSDPGYDFSTPCPEPDDGWRVLDESKATFEAMNATFAFAQTLDGYATSWMDQSPNPAAAPDAPAGSEMNLNDPLLSIVNVRVTGDPAAAEAALREVWGGMLCVTSADRTEAELVVIQNQVMEAIDGVLSSAANGMAGTVDVTVVYDDGTFQSRFDEEYGVGLVRVSSALVPAG